jgi:uncharacterized membrane protein
MDLAAHRDLALPAIQSSYMPLGNMTGLTDKERVALVAWLKAQNSLEKEAQ